LKVVHHRDIRNPHRDLFPMCIGAIYFLRDFFRRQLVLPIPSHIASYHLRNPQCPPCYRPPSLVTMPRHRACRSRRGYRRDLRR
jgi:hypothetical protein